MTRQTWKSGKAIRPLSADPVTYKGYSDYTGIGKKVISFGSVT